MEQLTIWNLDQELERRLREVAERRDTSFFTMETCNRFGWVAAGLRKAGTPIPVNDVWVAAHALQTGARLLTNDAHFACVTGLALVHPE